MQYVIYTTRWDRATGRPAAGHDWLSLADAEARYASGADLEALDAATYDADTDTVDPLWFVASSAEGFRVELSLPGEGLVRVAQWVRLDGRLWRSSTTEYLELDEGADTAGVVTTTTRPDGTSTVAYRDPTGETHVTELAGASTAAGWLDVPRFAEWGPVVNATFGVTSDPTG